MVLAIYRFKNGVLLNSEDEVKSLTYDGKDLEPLQYTEYYMKNRTFFIDESLYFKSELLKIKVTTLQPQIYILNKDVPLAKTISKEKYNSLTDYYKTFYKLAKEKEVVDFKDVECLELLSLDIEFKPLEHDVLSDLQKKVFKMSEVPPLLKNVYPKQIHHLLQRQITPENIFKILMETLKEMKAPVKGSVRFFHSSLIITIYEKEYHGEVKNRELKKQNGRSYATKRYVQVPDLPKAISNKDYSAASFKLLIANNQKELTDLVEKIILDIVNGLY